MLRKETIMSRTPLRPASFRLLPLFTLALAAVASAAPGQLDLRFGQDGVLTIGRGGDTEQVNALLPDAAGSVYAAGALFRPRAPGGSASGNDMAVVRLLDDGTLDPAFGEAGVTLINGGGDGEAAHAIVRQADGKLLVAGALELTSYTDFGVARLLPNGQLDTS